MTKKEIYEQVVRLTGEIAKTRVAERIVEYLWESDATKVQAVIDAFPMYHPELYDEIVEFGNDFNYLVGDSEEDHEERCQIFEKCKYMMYSLAETKIISQIAEAAGSGNPNKLQEIIDTFRKEHSYFTEKLLTFQQEYAEYRDNHTSGFDGAIFGSKADEENGVYVFDTNVIDALSFYIFTIFAKVNDTYFFCSLEEDPTCADNFYFAIEKVATRDFADFVASYNFFDWVDEYENEGELLAVAFWNEFDELVEEENE